MFKSLLTLSALVLLAAYSTSAAETWYIIPDGTGDAPTIQAGVDSAEAGETVMLANGTYTGTGNRDVDYRGKGIVIRSESGDPELCIIDCQGAEAEPHRGFVVDGTYPSLATLQGLTVTNGFHSGGAAVWVRDSDLTVNNCVFSENDSDSPSRGAVFIDGCNATLNNCVITGNSGEGLTGGFASCTLTDCEFSSNSGSGALFGGFSSTTITRPTLTARFRNYSSATITGCTFSDNLGRGLTAAEATVTVEDCTFSRNSQGGAALSYFTSADLLNCKFIDNSTPLGGGGVYMYLAEVTLTDCTFKGNTAESGGGLACGVDCSPDFGEEVRLNDCIFIDNSATNGGAVYWGSYLALTMSNCTLIGNSAANGGGICVAEEEEDCSPVALEHTIVAFNSGGRAIHCDNPASVDLHCCDVYGNAGGDWVGCSADQYGINGNIWEDPWFCNATNGDLRLAADSPCLNAACGLMGAYGRGCPSWRPAIVGVTDVGDDQGRQARVRWERSQFDAPGDTIDVMNYGVYRRQDAFANSSQKRSPTPPNNAPLLDGWDFLGSIPAHGDSVYQWVAPTLCDSTISGVCWSAFFVRAMTTDPLLYFDSDPDSGYSADNLAPAAPLSLSFTGPDTLGWDPAPEPDFNYFTVYGSSSRYWDQWAAIVGFTTAPNMDVQENPHTFYYVTATDFSGNEGPASSLDVTTGVRGTPRPLPLSVSTFPNPFNPQTTIVYSIPAAGFVAISVYDTRGGLVRDLVSQPQPAGEHVTTWDGRNNNGPQVTSGVYFVRITVGNQTAGDKLLLLK